MDISVRDNGYCIDIMNHFYFKGILLSIQAECRAYGGRISTTMLAVLIKSKGSKVKRHTRELLGRDSKAAQGTGYARLLTPQQAIEVYIYGLLIRNLNQRDIKKTIRRVVFQLKDSGVVLK